MLNRFIYFSLLLTFLFYLSCSDDPTSSNNDKETGTVTDFDGNIYKTIKIGDQWWMAENLQVTHYLNGDDIPNIQDASWGSLNAGAYCSYDNDSGNAAIYGMLYNWYAVDDSRRIAPGGWHVPTDEEWKVLEMYLGIDSIDVNYSDVTVRGTDEGDKLKAESGWANSCNGTDEVGFSGLPGGFRDAINARFESIDTDGMWWTVTESSPMDAWERRLECEASTVGRWFDDSKRHGFSVRCVKN